jgi:hypothetical protein
MMSFERSGRKTRHHVVPKSRLKKRQSLKNNIIRLDERRHAAFHALFKERTFIEAARALVRTYNIMNNTHYMVVEGGHNGKCNS